MRALSWTLAVMLGGASIVHAEPGVTDTEIVIGSCLSREGEKAKALKAMSQAAIEGASTYFNYVNEKGGINGRKIKYVVRDDAAEPEKSLDCFTELQEKDHMFALGANMGGAIPTAKYIRLAQTHKVPAIGFHANLDDIYEPVMRYVFGCGVPWSKSIAFSIDRLWNDAGKRRFAFIYSNDVFGNTNLEYARAAVKKHGAELVAFESFPRSTTEVDEPLQKVMQAKPDVILLGGNPPAGMAVLKKAKERGYKVLFVHTTGARGFDYPKLVGAGAEGYVFPANAPSPMEDKNPTTVLFKQMLKKYYPESEPEVMRLALFMDSMVLVEGLKRAGKDLTREKLIDALESLKGFDIGLGDDYKVTMSPTDHQAFDTVPFFVVRDGRPITLKNWKSLK